MRRPAVLAIVGVLLLVAAAARPADAAGVAACRGGFDPDGSSGSFYAQIRAKALSCPTARTVVRAWIRHQNKTDGANPTGRVTIRRMRCAGRVVRTRGDPNGGLAVTCVRGASAVSFYGHA